MARSLKLKDKKLQKKLQVQNMIIVALCVVIAVLVIVSSTAAWYIRTKTDTADIILGNPVNIYITEWKDMTDSAGNILYGDDNKPIRQHELKTDILEDYNTKIYPGDKIKMKLGIQMGTKEQESSVGYVRVKLNITYENIQNGELSGLQKLADQNLINYKDAPNTDVWEKIDFNKYKTPNPGEEISPDYWFVLREYDSEGNKIAKIARNLEQYEFLDGYIELNKLEITNKYANCKFHINYVVEAIQKQNVPDPIKYEGYGPWWNFALGDDEVIKNA